jgi:hypothetical protein
MTPEHRPSPLAGVGPAGRALWKTVLDDLPAELDFDPRELAILAAACRQADAVVELEQAIERDGVMIVGAAGQARMNACVTEARQGRLALARLLGDLDLPDEAEQPRSAASKRAQHAAGVRWDLAERRDGRRHGVDGGRRGPPS